MFLLFKVKSAKMSDCVDKSFKGPYRVLHVVISFIIALHFIMSSIFIISTDHFPKYTTKAMILIYLNITDHLSCNSWKRQNKRNLGGL